MTGRELLEQLKTMSEEALSLPVRVLTKKRIHEIEYIVLDFLDSDDRFIRPMLHVKWKWRK